MEKIDTHTLIQDFCKLAQVDGVSLRERRVVDFIKDYLGKTDVLVTEQSIPVEGAEAGNLFCVPRSTDTNKPVTILAAHMDTVRSTRWLRPVVDSERITSDGTSILGADNRAGVTALLNVLRISLEQKLKLDNIIILFTVAEEIGMVGANNIDLSEYPSIKRVFVFDCSRRPGVFIQHCYGCMKFRITVRGEPAHAGVAPEQGVNAIAIATAIVNGIRQGRLDDDTLINIGIIHGGEATNIVSSEVVFEGEIRGPSDEAIEQHLEEIRKLSVMTAEKYSGKIDFDTSLSFSPYFIDPATDHYKAAEKIIRLSGLEPTPLRYTGGSDANSFNQKGIPSVNFGIGAQQPHSNQEFILIEDLVKTTELALNAALEKLDD